MTNELAISNTITGAGLVANVYAAQQTFNDYQIRKSKNTLRAQYADLVTFAKYLGDGGVTACPTGDDLQSQPDAWQGVTWGLVKGFVKWMLAQGVALTSINRKLSTVKRYSELASQAGVIPAGDLALIQTVTGHAKKEFAKVDEKRTVTRMTERLVGGEARPTGKKGKSTPIAPDQAKALKAQPATAQGRRDAVIMALLLDHGLRVGELVDLQITDIDLANKELKFFRAKVDKTQRHSMSTDTFKALKAYINSGDAPAMGPLLRRSVKGGALGASGMTELGVNLRVKELGERVAIAGLGPHDCRHYWATKAVRRGTDPFALMQAGGWTSMQTVKKYVDENVIANVGVNSED